MTPWRTWLIGLANGAVSGMASGLAGGIAGVTLKQLLIIAGTSAIVSCAKWVIQHPLPGTDATVVISETKETVVTPPAAQVKKADEAAKP
jgi:hypothetical protein